MSRRPNLIPSKQLNLALPVDLHAKVTAHLYSELEGRVPLGAYQGLISQLLREYLDGKGLDLSPYISNVPPGSLIVRGTGEAIALLQQKLESV
jgi:hypothetical protein